LFDLENDLSEKRDLAAQMPEMVATLSNELDDYLETVGAEDVQDVFEAQYKHIAEQMAAIEMKYAGLIEASSDDSEKIAKLSLARDKQLESLRKFKEEKIDTSRICTNFEGNPTGDFRESN
jgi:transcription elongation factor GreA-like protein